MSRRLAVLLVTQISFQGGTLEPRPFTNCGKHREVRHIRALLEKGAKQTLGDFVFAAVLRAIEHEAVCV